MPRIAYIIKICLTSLYFFFAVESFMVLIFGLVGVINSILGYDESIEETLNAITTVILNFVVCTTSLIGFWFSTHIRQYHKRMIVIALCFSFLFAVELAAANSESTSKQLWDMVQTNLNCCGVTNATDWDQAANSGISSCSQQVLEKNNTETNGCFAEQNLENFDIFCKSLTILLAFIYAFVSLCSYLLMYWYSRNFFQHHASFHELFNLDGDVHEHNRYGAIFLSRVKKGKIDKPPNDAFPVAA
ncbi:Hypothetical predicted protein [Cloeon dipterum]|uniref:Tetraspanin n=1 Tax=Cloeon dipterum TaxID=197152 RepID=A0A8S1C6I4_9INSE|nr:Hypothetical predicted protein [Cloeon dipterum]